MGIRIRLDVLLAERQIRSKDLAERIGISPVNFSLLKQGKIKAIRIATLEKLCQELNCQPGDLLQYLPDEGGSGAD